MLQHEVERYISTPASSNKDISAKVAAPDSVVPSSLTMTQLIGFSRLLLTNKRNVFIQGVAIKLVATGHCDLHEILRQPI